MLLQIPGVAFDAGNDDVDDDVVVNDESMPELAFQSWLVPTGTAT